MIFNLLGWGPFPAPQLTEENVPEELERKLRRKEAQIESMHSELKSKQDSWAREKEILDKRLEKITTEQRYTLDCTEKWRKAYETLTKEHERILAEKQREVTGLLKENTQKTELLEARSLELTAAQAFLSKADTISEADVLQVVSDLNAQILQIAASLTGDWDGARYHMAHPDIFYDVESIYGRVFGLELSRSNPETLQAALQFSVLRCFQLISAMWDFQTTDATKQFDNIYAAIYASGKQAEPMGVDSILMTEPLQRSNQ
jgi:hypothetical protein